MLRITLKDVEMAVRTMADVAIENKKHFCDLDSVCGDADFGVSLSDGFQAVLNKWDTFDRSSIGSFLMKVGVVITSNVGGCSGPIWGTGFMKAGMASKDKATVTLADLVVMLQAAMEGMMARGGAKLGDKTLLDAIAPVAEKLAEWSQKNPDDSLGAMEAATEAATDTIESTRGWMARRGRQSFLGERSQGTLDPGIVAVATMLQAINQAVKESHK